MKNKIIFCFIGITFFCNLLCQAQNWTALDSGLTGTEVYVLFNDTSTNSLYAGGTFTKAGQVNANNIAIWNGVAWDSLGAGASGYTPIRCITKYNGSIYSAGAFFFSNIFQLAKWNGISWDTICRVGGGIFYDLKVYNNELYAFGDFTSVAGVPCNGIAKWDGITWTSLGGNFNLAVTTSAMYNGQLYVGGGFYNNGLNCMAKWNGSTWVAVGNGFVGFFAGVTKLVVYANELYAAGSFSVTDNSANPGNYIAKWNDTIWSDVGGGVMGQNMGNGQIFDAEIYNNYLYVGGVFYTAGGIPAQRIARWDGTNWCGLGSVMSGGISALGKFNNQLVIGGGGIIDGIYYHLVAQWSGGNFTSGCGNNSGINELENGYMISVFPNPITFAATIEIENYSNPDFDFVVYDVVGREIKSIEGIKINKFQFKREGLTNGMYFYSIRDGNSKVIIGQGKLLIN